MLKMSLNLCQDCLNSLCNSDYQQTDSIPLTDRSADRVSPLMSFLTDEKKGFREHKKTNSMNLTTSEIFSPKVEDQKYLG